MVDEALAKLGLARTVALTTPRFVAVPFLVAGAPVVTTMHAKLARFFAATLGLSLSPAPVELPEVSVSLLWHASYDHDPAHLWLRRTIVDVAGTVRDRRLLSPRGRARGTMVDFTVRIAIASATARAMPSSSNG